MNLDQSRKSLLSGLLVQQTYHSKSSSNKPSFLRASNIQDLSPVNESDSIAMEMQN